jgi:hypothetical protein
MEPMRTLAIIIFNLCKNFFFANFDTIGEFNPASRQPSAGAPAGQSQ